MSPIYITEGRNWANSGRRNVTRSHPRQSCNVFDSMIPFFFFSRWRETLSSDHPKSTPVPDVSFFPPRHSQMVCTFGQTEQRPPRQDVENAGKEPGGAHTFTGQVPSISSWYRRKNLAATASIVSIAQETQALPLIYSLLQPSRYPSTFEEGLQPPI